MCVHLQSYVCISMKNEYDKTKLLSVCLSVGVQHRVMEEQAKMLCGLLFSQVMLYVCVLVCVRERDLARPPNAFH